MCDYLKNHDISIKNGHAILEVEMPVLRKVTMSVSSSLKSVRMLRTGHKGKEYKQLPVHLKEWILC